MSTTVTETTNILATYTPCDVCTVARAHVVVTSPLSGLPIALCAHHYGEHATMLGVHGWPVTEDTRSTLLARPTSDVDADADAVPVTEPPTTSAAR